MDNTYDFSPKFERNLEESDDPDRFAVRHTVGVEEAEQVEKDGKLLFQVGILSGSQFLITASGVPCSTYYKMVTKLPSVDTAAA